MEAEGCIIRHWDRFSSRLENSWNGRINSKFWTALSDRTRQYFRQNKTSPPPPFPTWLHWKWSFTGADKLNFFVHSPFLLREMLPSDGSLNEPWRAWLHHVSFVRIFVQHSISAESILLAGRDIKEYHRLISDIYGEEIITINHHYETHLVTCIEWYSKPRLYWTFPQESINGVLKRYV